MTLLACGYDLDGLNLSFDSNIAYPFNDFENYRKKMLPQS